MKELQVRNRQRDRRINVELLRQIVETLLNEELELDRYELAIHLVSARRMSQVNERFLRHTGSTDVITFDYCDGYGEDLGIDAELAGEVFISVDDALRQAREFSTDWQDEIVRYVIHSLLHLQGHDDLAPAKRKIMKREENRLVRRMVKRFPLRKLAA